MDEDRHPETVAGFRVIRRLATGGTSDVLLARAEGPHGFERVVVLKLLLDRHRNDPAFERMFAREAAAYARLNHPAIVKLYDFFAAGDQLVMVLEFVDGMPLNRLRALLRVSGETMDDRACVYLASCVFAGLAAAHSARDPETGAFAPVIHRDVNPSNVLLPWDGHVKLADFGIAKVTGLAGDTKIGLIKGTFGYMSPEQVRGEEVSVRADVYAASLLFWELLARRRAIQHSALPEIEVLRAMAHPNIVSLDVLRPDLPIAVRELVRRGLEPIADKRDLTAEEVLKTLRATVPLEQGRQALIDALRRIRPRSEAEMAITADGSIAPPSAAASIVPATEPSATDRSPKPRDPDPASDSEMPTSIHLDPLSDDPSLPAPQAGSPSLPVLAPSRRPPGVAPVAVAKPPRPAPVARRATPPPRPPVAPRPDPSSRGLATTQPSARTDMSAQPSARASSQRPPVRVESSQRPPVRVEPSPRPPVRVEPSQRPPARVEPSPRPSALRAFASTQPLGESPRALPSIGGRVPSPGPMPTAEPAEPTESDPFEEPESIKTIKGGFSVPTGTPGSLVLDGGIQPSMGDPSTTRILPAAGNPPPGNAGYPSNLPPGSGGYASNSSPPPMGSSTVRMSSPADASLGYAKTESAFEPPPMGTAPPWYAPPAAGYAPGPGPAPDGRPYALSSPETRAPFDVADRRGRIWVLLAVVFVLMCGTALAIVLIRARAYDANLAAASASASARPPIAPAVSSVASTPRVSRPASSGVSLVASTDAADATAPLASAPASAASSAERPPPADTTVASAAASASVRPPASPSAPVASAPVASSKPPAADTATPPSSPVPGPNSGLVRTGSSARQHRIFVDGKYAGEGETALLVPCGKHNVQVGSHGTPQDVDVPCGGEISVK